MKSLPGIIHFIQSGLNNVGALDINPEGWHKIAMARANSAEKVKVILDFLTESFYLEDKKLEVNIGELTLKNPVGLAAGFAKQSHGLKTLEALGFGYLTIGGITWCSQSGNNKPRIFKFNKSDIVNGMGLPGDGAMNEVARLEKRKRLGLMPNIPIIANLCNSAITLEDEKINEFFYLMDLLYAFVDGFEINVSCPNQCGVTSMQQEKKLENLLSRIISGNERLAIRHNIKKRVIMVKIAPLTKYENSPEKIKDLTVDGLEMIANVCNKVGVDGVTATNTSQEHDYDTKIIKPDGGIIRGGLSGLSLHSQSIKTVVELRKRLNANIPIIGVGGIGYDNGESAVNMMNSGAVTVEILSSLIQNSIATPYYLKKAILESKR